MRVAEGNSYQLMGLFQQLFFSWYAVAASFYLLAVVPTLARSPKYMPVAAQVLGHARPVVAMTLVLLLWSGALAGLALVLSRAAHSVRPQRLALRINAAMTLSLFILIITLFAFLNLRGSPTPFSGFMELLLGTRFVGWGLAGCATILFLALGSRLAVHLWSLQANLGKLGVGLCACAVPFLPVFFFQVFSGTTAPVQPQPAHRPGAPAPNIIVVVLDALSMDKTSLPKEQEGFTPALRRFAEQSFLFSNAYAPTNFTTPSVTTLLTGKQPTSHGVFWLMALSGPLREQTLPAELRRSGFLTGATVGNIFANPRFIKIHGFDRIFPMRGRGSSARFISFAVRFAGFNLAELWRNSLISWLPTHFPDAGREFPWPPEHNFSDGLSFLAEDAWPRFLYLHVLPPHPPYLADPPFMYSRLPESGIFDTLRSYNTGYLVTDRPYAESESETVVQLERRYEENVQSVDARLGQFLTRLEEEGRFKDSIIVVLSDHGEMFETKWVGHVGRYLDDDLLHVPLMIHLPGQESGETVSAPIGLIDLAPTLLDLVDQPIPTWMEGVSWKSMLLGGPALNRPVYSYTFDAIDSLLHGGNPQGSCRMSWGSYQAVLILPLQVLSVIGPGMNHVIDFSDANDSGRVFLPGLSTFEEARRVICLREPVAWSGGTL